MRVFITGSAGFLGTNLIRHLNGRGIEVGGLDLPTPETYALEAMGPFESYQHFPGDVRVHQEVLSAVNLFEPDVVVHLAAVSTVQAAHENPRRTWHTNVLGTVNVLEVCRERNLPVIVASSDKAYGASPPPFYEDTTPLQPLFPYDVSKACADLIALSYGHTYDVVVTRSVNYFGPADLHWNRLVPGVFRALAMNEAVRVHRGMGSVRREWIHVSDVCRAYELLALNLDAVRRTATAYGSRVGAPESVARNAYNIGSGYVLTRQAMLDALLDAAGKPDAEVVQLVHIAHRELGDEWVSHAKLLGLGWEPKVPLDRGLEETWNWYRAYFGKEGSP